LARAGAVNVEIRTDLIDDVTLGDLVLVHAGFAIEKLQEEEGREIEALFEEVRRLADEIH
jgi:hydrogenase expression/formation protein HypC